MEENNDSRWNFDIPLSYENCPEAEKHQAILFMFLLLIGRDTEGKYLCVIKRLPFPAFKSYVVSCKDEEPFISDKVKAAFDFIISNIHAHY